MNQKLFDFIKAAPTAYHATAEAARRLTEQEIASLKKEVSE